jgi:hypothetical protein
MVTYNIVLTMLVPNLNYGLFYLNHVNFQGLGYIFFLQTSNVQAWV